MVGWREMCLSRAHFDEAAEGTLIRVEQHFDGHILDAAPQALVHLRRQAESLPRCAAEGQESTPLGWLLR